MQLQSTESDFVGWFATIQHEMVPTLISLFQSQVLKMTIIFTYGSFKKISGGLEMLFTGLCFALLHFLIAKDFSHVTSLEKKSEISPLVIPFSCVGRVLSSRREPERSFQYPSH